VTCCLFLGGTIANFCIGLKYQFPMSRIEVAYGICRAVKLIDHPAIWPFGPQLLKEGDRLRYSPGIRVCQRQSRALFRRLRIVAGELVRCAHFLTSSSSLMSVASIAFPERLDMRCYHGHAFGRGRRSRGTAVGRVDPLHGDRACRLLNRSCAAACADMLTIEEGKRYLGITPA
jgi:hypothetical protein